MTILLLFVLFGIVAVDICAAILVAAGRNVRKWLSYSYFAIVLLAIAAAVLITSFYSYYANPNTHVFGWPVPRVIFQRDTPTSPWLDYVGTISMLSYPLNFIFYMLVPSLITIVLVLRWRKHDKKRTSSN
jgi:hypothetical protein